MSATPTAQTASAETSTRAPELLHPVVAMAPAKLWTSTSVAVITFFLGYPGGLVLASLNWLRMGLGRKAILHLVGGAAGTLTLILFSLFLPAEAARVLFLPVNIVMVFYLQSQTKKDIEALKANGPDVQNAHWFVGVLVALASLGLYYVLSFMLGFFVAIIFTLFGVPLPQ